MKKAGPPEGVIPASSLSAALVLLWLCFTAAGALPLRWHLWESHPQATCKALAYWAAALPASPPPDLAMSPGFISSVLHGTPPP